jgi:hypothetical protein
MAKRFIYGASGLRGGKAPMRKTFNPTRFKINFQTREGTFFILLLLGIALVHFLVFIFFVLPPLRHLGQGDWMEGARRLAPVFRRPLNDYIPLLRGGLYVLLGGLAAIMLMRWCIPVITVDDDSIEAYYPILRLLAWMPFKKKIAARTRINFFDVDNVFTDVAFLSNGEILFTVLQADERQIALHPGFAGYFEIMDQVETRAPQAAWDQNTLRLMDDECRVSVFRAEREIKKEYKRRFREAVPSWWKRWRLADKARRGRKFLYKDFFASAKSEDEGETR